MEVLSIISMTRNQFYHSKKFRTFAAAPPSMFSFGIIPLGIRCPLLEHEGVNLTSSNWLIPYYYLILVFL